MLRPTKVGSLRSEKPVGFIDWNCLSTSSEPKASIMRRLKKHTLTQHQFHDRANFTPT